MTLKQELLNALSYGKSAYYQAIREVPSYQNELARTRTDFNERTWTDPLGVIPKFTTSEFNKRREQYQAKYGTSVNIPGFKDVIHILPRATISAEEMAAHKFAQKRKLPSPLNPDQLALLTYKKDRFLRALASPTPTFLKTYASVATCLDNLEDALVTISVMGRIAVKITPRLMGKTVPVIGWTLLGADILNLANIMSWATFTAKGAKRHLETHAEKNPFHAKAKASRAAKLNRALPTFGEFLEILQTTDQLFGVGLCLGGLMGLVTECASSVASADYWLNLYRLLTTGTVSEIASNVAGVAANDYDKIKTALQEQYYQLRDEAYRLKAVDQQLRQDIYNWTDRAAKDAWGWIKAAPEKASNWFSKTLIGSMIVSTGKEDFLKDNHTKAFLFLNQAMTGVMPWWKENDPLLNFKQLRDWKWKAPEPTDPATIDSLEENVPNWRDTLKWPHLEEKYATIQEITLEYAPRIKDSFQAYCMNYQHEYEAMAAAFESTDFVKSVIRSMSDDGQVQVGMSAYWASCEDMLSQVYLIPPDTPGQLITALANYIGETERRTGGAPYIQDLVRYGERIGIRWMRTFPAKTFKRVAEIFPGWQAIQDQIGQLFFSD